MSQDFWDVTPHPLLNRYRRSEGSVRLHILVLDPEHGATTRRRGYAAARLLGLQVRILPGL
jgi:hypothetical protein